MTTNQSTLHSIGLSLSLFIVGASVYGCDPGDEGDSTSAGDTSPGTSNGNNGDEGNEDGGEGNDDGGESDDDGGEGNDDGGEGNDDGGESGTDTDDTDDSAGIDCMIIREECNGHSNDFPGCVDDHPECFECFDMWVCQEFSLEEDCPDIFDSCEHPGYDLSCKEAEAWCQQTVENEALLGECVYWIGGPDCRKSQR
ncbi:MAG: hypothetical protein AAGF11_03505 [Myxococcota bacterium]